MKPFLRKNLKTLTVAALTATSMYAVSHASSASSSHSNLSAGAPGLVSTAYAIPASTNATAPRTPADFPSNPNIYVDLAKKVVPAVVNISTVSVVKNIGFRHGGAYPGAMPSGPEDFFREFFG